MKKQRTYEHVLIDKIVGGGQSLATLEDGRKAFLWGGLPSEVVMFHTTKQKTNFVEGVVDAIETPSAERIAPKDPDSYLSTSPWQIMNFNAEQHYKAALIEEAFELHDIVLPSPIEIATDGQEFGYRNKVEFSWYGDNIEPQVAQSPRMSATSSQELVNEASCPVEDCSSIASSTDCSDISLTKTLRAKSADKRGERAVEIENQETLDLAFFRRGSKGKIPVDGTSLAREEINTLARAIRDLLRTKPITARNLKTLLIRSDQHGNCVWQLYIKDEIKNLISEAEASQLPAQGGEVIYSEPKSPASRITKRLERFGNIVLEDTILNIPFRYATEGFFQINLPVYEMTLQDMKRWIEHANKSTPKTLDLYSGVGTIGLTIGGTHTTLVEINEHAVREMRENIAQLGRQATTKAILAPAENVTEYITSDMTVIVDPPRAGLHTKVIEALLEQAPPRIIYLSCNPVTQARDTALLAEKYGVRAHKGYNFFPRTPHIEHLVVLDKKPSLS